MTTDDKTDGKPNNSLNPNSTESNEPTNSTQSQTQTSDTTDVQTVDNKIPVIETNSEGNSAQIKPNNECLKDNQMTDNIETIETIDNSDNVSQTDVEMRNAQSLDNMSVIGLQTETNNSSEAVDTKEPSDSTESVTEEMVSFKLIFKKNNFDITIGLKKSVSELKEQIQRITSVAPSMQKLLYKGIPLNDSKTLNETGIKNGVKVMLIGSTLNDVIAVNSTSKEEVKEESKATTSTREPFCKQKQHKKVLDRGMPEDVMPAWKNGTAPLPREPLHGMINKYNHKVRLTFKLEQDQLWVGTKERTEKLSMMSIRSIVSEPIEDHPEYHVMGIQTGPTEASRIWLYWVPSQFVDAIKDTILGK